MKTRIAMTSLILAAFQAFSCVSEALEGFGYAHPLPFLSQPPSEQNRLRSILPLSGVGAVNANKKPFRATAIYLGTFERVPLFGISAHVLQLQPQSVEFGQLSGSKFSIDVESKPIFKTLAGDFAILRASRLTSAAKLDRLRRIQRVALSFRPFSELLQQHPQARTYIAGRGLRDAVLTQIKNSPGLWPDQDAAKWIAAVSEAQLNQDFRDSSLGAPQGDIFVFGDAPLVSGTALKRMRDGDGLKIGEPGDPFLSSPWWWDPVSMAFRYVGIGRMSGSPIFFTDGATTYVIAVHWTKGVPMDLTELLPKVQQNPELAFGDVRAEFINGAAEPQLVLKQVAPFAFAGSMEATGLALALTILRANGLRKQDLHALRGLLAASDGNLHLLKLDECRSLLQKFDDPVKE